MIGHLGERISALLDGQLSPEEEERAWAHVHACHTCRDQVEREGWVKTRLACLSDDTPACDLRDGLKGELKAAMLAGLAGDVRPLTPAESYLVHHQDPRPRRFALVALGGGAAGAAVMGVLALGAAPADAPGPTFERRVPVTQVSNPGPVSVGQQQRRAGQLP